MFRFESQIGVARLTRREMQRPTESTNNHLRRSTSAARMVSAGVVRTIGSSSMSSGKRKTATPALSNNAHTVAAVLLASQLFIWLESAPAIALPAAQHLHDSRQMAKVPQLRLRLDPALHAATAGKGEKQLCDYPADPPNSPGDATPHENRIDKSRRVTRGVTPEYQGRFNMLMGLRVSLAASTL